MGLAFIWKGRLFHNNGAATEKALSPFVLRLEGGTARSLREVDLSVLVAGGTVIRSEIYEGARRFGL